MPIISIKREAAAEIQCMCAFTTVVEKSWAHENYFLYSTTHFVEVAQKYNVKYAQTSSFNKKKLS